MFILSSKKYILAWDRTPNINNEYAMRKQNCSIEIVKESNYLNIVFLLGVCLYINRCAHTHMYVEHSIKLLIYKN